MSDIVILRIRTFSIVKQKAKNGPIFQNIFPIPSSTWLIHTLKTGLCKQIRHLKNLNHSNFSSQGIKWFTISSPTY